MSGQSIKDRVLAAKHSIAGQGLAKTVGKATTEEVMGPKKKHLDCLLAYTNEPNISIPNMADQLIQRTQDTSWVVVFKSLIAVHNLMNYGNERFIQYLASNNCSFSLANFLDKQNVQGYDMSTFIRRYSKYVNEKAVSYRLMAFDFCKVKRGKDDGVLRLMATDKLLKALPVLQTQLDALLEFDCTPNELTNGVINACFMLLFKDLIRLFACYNDGIINLLEKYFEMNKKQCKEGLDLYKKFLVRMDKVSEFLKTAENVGIDKGEIPDLAKAPASLLEALEAHLASLEGKKGATTTSHPKPAAINNAISALSSNTGAPQGYTISEAEKRRIIQEEERQLQQLKEQRARDTVKQQSTTAAPAQTATSTAATRPAPVSAAPQADLFGSPAPQQQAAAQSNPSDDLLQLSGSPWQASIENVLVVNQAVHAMSTTQTTMGAMASPQRADPWGQGPVQQNSNGFTSDTGFAAAFGGAPQSVNSPPPPAGFDGFGEVLQPQKNEPQMKPQQQKLFHDNVDTSLASLADNLAINPSAQVKKQPLQWKPQGEKVKTGGANFQQMSMSSSTTTAWQQNAAPMMMQPGMMSYGQPAMAMQQPYMQAGMHPRPVGMQPVGMAPMMMQPMGGAYPMGMPVQPQFGMAGQPIQQPQQQATRQMQPNDPFGL